MQSVRWVEGLIPWLRETNLSNVVCVTCKWNAMIAPWDNHASSKSSWQTTMARIGAAGYPHTRSKNALIASDRAR